MKVTLYEWRVHPHILNFELKPELLQEMRHHVLSRQETFNPFFNDVHTAKRVNDVAVLDTDFFSDCRGNRSCAICAKVSLFGYLQKSRT